MIPTLAIWSELLTVASCLCLCVEGNYYYNSNRIQKSFLYHCWGRNWSHSGQILYFLSLQTTERWENYCLGGIHNVWVHTNRFHNSDLGFWVDGLWNLGTVSSSLIFSPTHGIQFTCLTLHVFPSIPRCPKEIFKLLFHFSDRPADWFVWSPRQPFSLCQ